MFIVPYSGLSAQIYVFLIKYSFIQFQPGYWCGATWDTGDAENRAKGYKSVFSSNPYNEADPKNLRAGINIAGLTKKFGAKVSYNIACYW